MTYGLVSATAVLLYGGTVSLLALTATFARRATLRRDARASLAVLVRAGRPEGASEGAEADGP
ncbi:hypothetical protein SAMN06297387_11048 [Streptomyces zhaozhouensis]|uniref:Heme exporter protein D n=1 Tax=Streptomyces zhaozhouensis TaxID=1300267 RepID=A0A286DXF4_9ACTN|nr:hypothetical protein [Streptomyces zhaozhouensis]SOD63316.1 hypothetical protein SAMN06297387_11048 [Streptomyces zhaozhouensis]